MIQPRDIRAIIFDLDGTLYVSPGFEQVVWQSVSNYTAQLLGCSPGEGDVALRNRREELTKERGTVQTIASAIETLGGSIQEMHRRFADEIDPTHHIHPSPDVTRLMEEVQHRYTSWLLTNNNAVLTGKILQRLDLTHVFHRIITIDDTWLPKPDATVLTQILAELALAPHQILFVGDRYDIDLRLPAAAGCQVFLTQEVDELLRLGELLLRA